MGNKITRRRPAIDDRHTRPQGLYPCKDVDQRKLRRLILDSKLAPCYPGGEEPVAELEECPICFLNYPSLNRSKCCTKGICTECFLQVKSPNVFQPTQCPYCKMANYSVEYRGPKSMEEKGMEQVEEQKVIEAKIRMRQQELLDDEEREQRRKNDIQDDPPPCAAILPPDSDGDGWHAAWETISHPSQNPLSSGLPETEVVEPDSLWIRGSHQLAANDEHGAPQQTLTGLTPQQAMPALRRQGIGRFPTVQQPLGAHLTHEAAPSGFSWHNRDDEFNLDLEDIMVMEAIWLSIQEQGARYRYPDDELCRAAPPVNLSVFGRGSEVDTDSGALPLPLQQTPPSLQLPLPLSVSDIQEQAPGRCSPVTGGLAGAIAALAEWQVVGGDTTSAAQQSIINTLPPEPALVNRRAIVSGTNQNCETPNREEALETASQT